MVIWALCLQIFDILILRVKPNKPSTVLFSFFSSDLDQGGVPADTTQDHALVPALTEDPEVGLTAVIIVDDIVTAIHPCLLADVILETGYVCYRGR